VIAGLILAGGEGRRLGGADKALVSLGAETLLGHLLARLDGQVGAVAISANGDSVRFAAFGKPVLGDGPFAGQGPLAGLLAGLDWAAELGAGELLTVPCDTPFVPADLVARLGRSPARAASGGQPHHLVALWPVAARVALRARLSETAARGVAEFSASLGMRTVAFSSVAFAGAAWDPFLNINTPEDLAMARDFLGRSENRG